MAKYKDLPKEIDDFIGIWGMDEMIGLLEDIIPILELYNVDENDDWVKDSIATPDDVRNIRVIRTVYLLSKFADKYAGKLSIIKATHKDLWKRMDEVKV